VNGDSASGVRAVVTRNRAAVGVVLAALCLGLAVLWVFVVPAKAGATTGVQEAAIRYGHPVCWALLATASVLFAVRAPRRSVDVVVRSALAAYVVFVVATVV